MLKNVYCDLVLELSVYDAVANYNYGNKATLDIFTHLEMLLEFYTKNVAIHCIFDKNKMWHTTIVTTKQLRKVFRGEKGRKLDKQTFMEGGSLLLEVVGPDKIDE